MQLPAVPLYPVLHMQLVISMLPAGDVLSAGHSVHAKLPGQASTRLRLGTLLATTARQASTLLLQVRAALRPVKTAKPDRTTASLAHRARASDGSRGSGVATALSRCRTARWRRAACRTQCARKAPWEAGIRSSSAVLTGHRAALPRSSRELASQAVIIGRAPRCFLVLARNACSAAAVGPCVTSVARRR